MARADLNVRLGVITRNFEKSLDRASRKLRRTAQSMESVGTSLTQAVSLPIVGVGIGALKSAAEFEQFEKALIAVTGSTEEAQRQLTRLQKIAEAPGIGFNQAVAASLQLQGLGVDAGRAEEAITQVANAVAASGGGAQEFEGVVRQLNQIQAKNQVLQEDIGILLENAPVLGEQLQEAFGGKTAEAIRAAGVNGEQFFDILVKQLATLERVEGGLANTFENFGISVRKALADVGQEIDKVVGVQSIVDRLTRLINEAVQTFKNLDKQTKVNVLRFLAFSAAVGPVVFLGAKIITIYRGAFSVFAAVSKQLVRLGARFTLLASSQSAAAASAQAANTSSKGLISTFRALTGIQQAFVAIPLAAAIGAIALVFDEYKTNVAAARAEITVLNNAQVEAAKTIASEVGQLEALRSQLTDANATRGEQAEAIQRIKDINPGYFSDLDTETTKISDVEKALDSYIQKLTLTAELKNLTDELGRVSAALNNNAAFAEEAEKNVSLLDKAQIAAAGIFSSLTKNYSALTSTVASETAEATNLTVNSLNRQKDAIDARVKEIQKTLSSIGGNRTATTTTTTNATPTTSGESIRGQVDAITQSLKSVQNTGGLASIAPPSAVESLTAAQERLQGINETMKQSIVDTSEYGSVISTFTEKFPVLSDQITKVASALQQGLTTSFEDLFTTLIEGGKNAFGSFAKALGQAVKQMLVQLAAAIAQAAILAVLINAIFPGAGGFRSIFGGILQGGNPLSFIPGFAEGGIVPPGYPNDTYLARLSSNEAVIPLSKLSGMMERSQPVVAETVIRGEDIVLSYNRANQTLGR